ncbi:leucine-rich repeat-containing protein 34 [Cololabis saira]|uniref:leucine-rich repeat-containing protein 34 n=1 Tax=Cololabis saira TaxID=129043 RepID=UPI002AD5A2A5|nr:leucine-rich repeat-containing protein 34 [Cololabis saira]
METRIQKQQRSDLIGVFQPGFNVLPVNQEHVLTPSVVCYSSDIAAGARSCLCVVTPSTTSTTLPDFYVCVVTRRRTAVTSHVFSIAHVASVAVATANNRFSLPGNACRSTMAAETFSKFYQTVCCQNDIKVNPDVLETLEKTKITWNFTLKLRGNDQLARGQRLGDDDVLALSKCLQNNDRVTGLDVSYNHIADGGAGHLAELLQAKDSVLSSLDLAFNDVQADGAEALARSLQGNSSLLSLRLSGNKIGRTGAMHVARMLQVNNTLQEVELANCDLETHAVIALSIVLRTNTTLRCVDVSRPLLFSQQEEWAVHFSQVLAQNCSLLELRLGTTGLTDTGMERLADGLKQNRTLRYLDLRCNRVSRDGALHLAEALVQDSALEVLDLSFNRIEDEGAASLGRALVQPGCSLKELSVCSNHIGADGLLALVRALKATRTLTRLFVWGNQLEEPVCQAFRGLLARGRLSSRDTDVRAYEVDGRVFLAQVSQGPRRRV